VNNTEARRAVLVSAGGIVVIRTIHRFAHAQVPKPHDYIAIGAAFVMLGFAAEVAPDIAGMIAIVALVAAALADGGEVFDAVSTAVGTPPVDPKKKGKKTP
jgi:hypothetical protein